jgi:hypothetical protein
LSYIQQCHSLHLRPSIPPELVSDLLRLYGIMDAECLLDCAP